MPKNIRDDYKDKEILEKMYESMSETDKDADRKMRIFEDWLEGDSFTTLSKTYDRTVERMRQIVAKMRRKYNLIKVASESDPMKLIAQNFTVRIFGALWRAGLSSMTDLTEMTETQFRKIRNLGKTSQEIVINRMIELGLQFKPEEEESVDAEPIEEEPSTNDMTPSVVNPHCEDGEWTYYCPRHKALDEVKNHLKNAVDIVDIIARDNDADVSDILSKLNETLDSFQPNIYMISIIIPETIIPSQRDEIIECAKRIANKYNFDVKFIHSEDILYPVIDRPTNITVDILTQIDSEFRWSFPVQPYVIK